MNNLLKIAKGVGVILLSVFCLLGCDYSSSGWGSAKDVRYTVNGLQISHNADEERDYTVVGVGTDYKILTWTCGNYKGFIKKAVELTFLKQNSWILDREEVSSSRCR